MLFRNYILLEIKKTMFHGVNMCFNLSDTLVTKLTTGNEDDALVDALTSNELVNEVGHVVYTMLMQARRSERMNVM